MSIDLNDFVSEKTKLYILLNHETKVRCEKPDGLPQPTITWEKADNQPLPKKFDVEGCCTLRKNRTKQIDSGNYTCIAKNLVGIKSKTVEIIVSGEFEVYFFMYFNAKFSLIREGSWTAPGIFEGGPKCDAQLKHFCNVLFLQLGLH